MVVVLQIRKIMIALLIGVFLLALANIGVDALIGSGHPGLARLFNQDCEANIPTYYSSFLLLCAAAALALISLAKRHRKNRHCKHWTAFAFVFALLSLDETAQIHEMGNGVLEGFARANNLRYPPWVILGCCVSLIIILALSKLLLSLPRRTQLLFFMAGSMFLFGSVGMEVLPHISGSIAYRWAVAIEESAEMLGVIVFIYGLLSYYEFSIGKLIIQTENRAKGSSDREPTAIS